MGRIGSLHAPSLLHILVAFAAVPAADPAASGLMSALERAQRSGDRMFSMDIVYEAAGFRTARRMLGVSHHDGRTTRILYSISWPRTLRGASLVIADPLDPGTPDAMWFALPGLQTAQEVRAGSLRLVVPGTGLTYEESRGWIATDKYRFETRSSVGEEVTIEAHPRNDSLTRLLGTSRLVIRADTRKKMVTGVISYDEAGNEAKSYQVLNPVRLSGHWYPGRVEIRQRNQQFTVEISYHYAALKRPPPQELFRVDPGSRFLDRMLAWRDRSGLAAAFPDSLTGP